MKNNEIQAGKTYRQDGAGRSPGRVGGLLGGVGYAALAGSAKANVA